jgi:kynurenine formamidase
MPTYPGDPEVRIGPHATHKADGYQVSKVELGTHTGTHVDAPAHVDPDGATLGSFDLEDLRFEARVVDRGDVEAGGAIEPDALTDLGGVEGDRRDPGLDDLGALVFRTGWESEWGADRMTRHPFLAAETAIRCADAGVAVAIDALSPDPSDRESDFPAHHALLGAGLPIVENVCNLDALPDGPFELLVCPLRVDADGAPARVLARV